MTFIVKLTRFPTITMGLLVNLITLIWGSFTSVVLVLLDSVMLSKPDVALLINVPFFNALNIMIIDTLSPAKKVKQ